MNHFVSNHPEFPLEKGRALDAKTKLIMNTVRDTVLAILDNRTSVNLKKYPKKINWHKSQKKLGNMIRVPFSLSEIQNDINESKGTPDIKKSVKKGVHSALEEVGIDSKNTKKKIHTAIDALGRQYRVMSPERFLHRLENGKVKRDTTFLIGMIRYMSQLGKEGLSMATNKLLSSGNYPGLYDSDSIKALNSIIGKAKEVLKTKDKKDKSKGGYKEFKQMLGTIVGEVEEK